MARAVAGVILGIGSALGIGAGADPTSSETPAIASALQPIEERARQVTLFGIQAVPNNGFIDPKLQSIADQLRRAKPNHGFRLIRSQTQRLEEAGTLVCELVPGSDIKAKLVDARDPKGQVCFDFQIVLNRQTLVNTRLLTPPNQLLFVEKSLPDGTLLLVGLGAR